MGRERENATLMAHHLKTLLLLMTRFCENFSKLIRPLSTRGEVAEKGTLNGRLIVNNSKTFYPGLHLERMKSKSNIAETMRD